MPCPSVVKISASCAFLVATSALAEDSAPPLAVEESWQFAAVRDGVSVWFRRFGASSVNEVRGEAVYDVSAVALFAVLGDIESYAEFMPPTSVSRKLSADGSGKSYYIEIDPPVVSRRYYCMDVNLLHPRSDVFISEWKMWTAGCVPRKSSLVPMRDNHGRWRLSALSPTKTRVEFQAHMDPGGQIPTWMVNRATLSQITDTFGSLKRAAMLPRYASATAPEPQSDLTRAAATSKN